jgi:ATPase subunit of ABC transporter with duplicated ATPase domains
VRLQQSRRLRLRSRKLTAYRGNYDVFEKTAAERLRNQRKAAESVAHKKQHMQAGPRSVVLPHVFS